MRVESYKRGELPAGRKRFESYAKTKRALGWGEEEGSNDVLVVTLNERPTANNVQDPWIGRDSRVRASTGWHDQKVRAVAYT